MPKVRVRYAPSPTGVPHVGGIRTALFNFLLAKSSKGDFILRIEDTDRKRYIAKSVDEIKKSLESLSLKWDECFVQSQRLDIYAKYLEQLKKKGIVYEDEGAWRYQVEKGKKLDWHDGVHGTVQFLSDTIEDFIIVKSDKFPTYHFASVVDDTEMKISHVLRGDEWLPSTPKHLMLYEALGCQPPTFIHVPVILGSDHKKLSKREGAESVTDYLDQGYLPEAIINFLALLGWAPKSNKEIFSLDELTKEFSLDRLNKNSPIFNIDKLDWFNGEWIRRLTDEDLSKIIRKNYPRFELSKITQVLTITKDRLNKTTDFGKIADFFFQKPDLNEHKKDIAIAKNIFEDLLNALEKVDSWTENKISTTVSKIMTEKNLSKAQMYRSIGIALSGRLITPPIFPSMQILGKTEVTERLKYAAKSTKEE